jgi:putative DNA primase/helicase
VVKRVVRQTRPGLSRPPSKLIQGATGRPLPKQFTAWCGVRFRTDDDLEEMGNDQD